MSRSLSAAGLLWRTLAIIAAVFVVPGLICTVGEQVHAYRHPAPLGSTVEAMRAHVDSVLPAGTSLDSATRHLRSLGLRTEAYDAVEARRSLPGDTLLTDGPAVLAVYADTGSIFSGAFDGWIGSVTLYFTPAGRLLRRDARVTVVNPL